DASAPARPAAAQPGQTAPAPVPVPSPAQLPPEVAGFAGRTAELHWLHGLLPGFAAAPAAAAAGAPTSDPTSDPTEDPTEDPAGTLVALITGTAGVGKTTLALRF